MIALVTHFFSFFASSGPYFVKISSCEQTNGASGGVSREKKGCGAPERPHGCWCHGEAAAERRADLAHRRAVARVAAAQAHVSDIEDQPADLACCGTGRAVG